MSKAGSSKDLVAAAAIVLALGASSGASSAGTQAFEVSYGPDSHVLAYPVSGGGVTPGFETVILHNIGVFNRSPGTLRLERVRIDAVQESVVTESYYLSSKDLEKSAAVWSRRQSAGLLRTHEPLLQVAKQVAGRRLAEGRELAANSGLLIARTPMLIRSGVDEILLTAEGTTADGRKVSQQSQIPVSHFNPKSSYRFPLCGRWLIAVGPNLNGHHRWGTAQEFAIDIVKVGADMKTHAADGRQPTDFYAFGSPVLAASSGVVVAVEAGKSEGELGRPGETPEEARKRSAALQEKLIASGFRNVFGNFVVIEHPNGEYSQYAHLKENSIRVRVGDKVAVGTTIGQLGHSGGSTEPHLHFSIQDGADPLRSRSLPFRFEGIAFWDEADGGTGILNSGQIVDPGC